MGDIGCDNWQQNASVKSGSITRLDEGERRGEVVHVSDSLYQTHAMSYHNNQRASKDK